MLLTNVKAPGSLVSIFLVFDTEQWYHIAGQY